MYMGTLTGQQSHLLLRARVIFIAGWVIWWVSGSILRRWLWGKRNRMERNVHVSLEHNTHRFITLPVSWYMSRQNHRLCCHYSGRGFFQSSHFYQCFLGLGWSGLRHKLKRGFRFLVFLLLSMAFPPPPKLLKEYHPLFLKGQNAKGKRQKAKGKRQKAKGKKQKAKSKRQKAKSKKQTIHMYQHIQGVCWSKFRTNRVSPSLICQEGTTISSSSSVSASTSASVCVYFERETEYSFYFPGWYEWTR